MLVENNNIISSEIETAEKLNAFFSTMVKELNIKVKEDLLCDVSDINDPVERAIQKYKNHPSIQMIKESFDSSKTFSSDLVSSDTIFKEIVSLDTKKEEVISQLEKSSKSIFEWFENNGMKAYPDKRHLLLSKIENFEANINENRISHTRFEKLLGITFNNQLKFNHHISKKAASNKLHALARASNYIDEDKRRIPFNSYFSSQFNYCPLIWMNHNKSINKKNNLHERVLRLIYCDHSSDFQELLQTDNSVTIHQKNIQAL